MIYSKTILVRLELTQFVNKFNQERISNKIDLYRLEVLNLEDNKLGDKNIMKVLKALLNSNNKLKSLNISKNYLTNEIAEMLKETII